MRLYNARFWNEEKNFMDDDKRALVQSWLLKAQHDLLSAERLAEGEEPLLDTAAYHCQQAAEKALKGFLVYHDCRFQKTHDLALLLVEANHFTQDFVLLDSAAGPLTRDGIVFRYPEAQMEPTQAEFEQAYQDAAQFVSIALALIPAEAHPMA
jgi:HEPN domain-containing protein